MFDKIRPGLSEQNKLEHMFVLWFYRIFKIYYWHSQLIVILYSMSRDWQSQKIFYKNFSQYVDIHDILWYSYFNETEGVDKLKNL